MAPSSPGIPEGFESLRRAVAPFTPEIVAARAGLDPADIVAAARTFAGGKRGCVVCSTGASFSTRSNLTFYLALCLNTLCGRWGREGDVATYPNVMLPAFEPKAQAYPPYPVFGSNALRVRGLRENASGLPAAALADEILTEGPGQIRGALLSRRQPARGVAGPGARRGGVAQARPPRRLRLSDDRDRGARRFHRRLADDSGGAGRHLLRRVAEVHRRLARLRRALGPVHAEDRRSAGRLRRDGRARAVLPARRAHGSRAPMDRPFRLRPACRGAARERTPRHDELAERRRTHRAHLRPGTRAARAR